MGKLSINIEYFFDHPDGFPWDVLGLSRPYSGPLHGYLCDAAMLFVEAIERDLLAQRPALFEIGKFANIHHGIFENIYEYCRINGNIQCRFSKAELVVNWLHSQRNFKDYMQKRLDSLWRQGLISIPEGAKPQEKYAHY